MPAWPRVLGLAPEPGHDPLSPLQRAGEHGELVRTRPGPGGFYEQNSPIAASQALARPAS